MNDKHDFLTIDQLSKGIETKIHILKDGNLNADRLVDLLDQVRKLEEALIIMKHDVETKAAAEPQEKVVPKELDQEDKTLSFNGLLFDLEQNEELVKEEPAMNEEELVDANQISLIDSIEEVSREKNIPTTVVNDTPQTVGQKLKSSAITDINGAFKINQRLGVIKQLFAGDQEKFATEIEKLNSANDLDQALDLFSSLKTDLEWDEENEFYQQLENLVQRRYA